MAAQIQAFGSRSTLGLIAAAAACLIVLILVPGYFGTYQVQLLTYGLIAAIAALGFNLLLGYTGLLSFGHSAYFGVGAYSVAFAVEHLGPHSMEFYLLLGIPAVAVTSALFGYICVRHTQIFFGILTLAISQVIYSLAMKLFWVTGGSDGMRVPRPALLFGALSFSGPSGFQQFIHSYYYYVLAIFIVCVLLMWVIVHSPFGKALQGIRDNEIRARFLGLRIRRFRWIAFLVSGTFTGVAGILWAPLNGLTTPDVLYWTFSGEIVFTALLGGFRNFTGPLVGGIVFTYLKSYAVATTSYWQLLLGVVLVTLVLVLPTGIVGALSKGFFEGSLNRLEYFVRWVGFNVGFVITVVIIGLLNPGLIIVFAFAGGTISGAVTGLILILAVLNIVLASQRFRDMGRSGWLSLFLLIPIVNLATLCVLFFAPSRPAAGNAGPGALAPAR